MKLMAVAGVLITLPAIVVILFFLTRPEMMLPAVASLALNSLPFIVAILLIRHAKRRGASVEDFEH
jgi:Mn2+/Fe2+ NRAMP family transporter